MNILKGKLLLTFTYQLNKNAVQQLASNKALLAYALYWRLC